MAVAKLSPKQRAFVNEYVVDFNGTQAAIRAGYSDRGANVAAVRLLSNATVLTELAKVNERKDALRQISVNEVLTMLEREATAGDLDQPNSARIKAQELIGKHIGMFSDKVTGQNTGAGPPIINIQFGVKVNNQLTDSPMPDRLTTHEQEADNGE